MRFGRIVGMDATRLWARFAVLFVAAVVCLTPWLAAQTTYVWNATSGGSWQTSTNWTPNRTSPATTDIMVFSTGGSYTVNDVPVQTVGQIVISNSTLITIQAYAGSPPLPAVTFTIGGGSGIDLSIESGSQLKITNPSSNTSLTISMVTGTTASIAGSIVFAGASAKLTPTDANAIQFLSGSSCTGDTGFSGNPFGTTAYFSVVFNPGSSYVHKAGSNPFGAAAPNSVVLFQSGSLYSHQSTLTPSLSGRTYADFELASSGSVTGTGSSALTMDNLTVTSGTFNINLTTMVNVKGNIAVATGATLNFNPASAATLVLNGTLSQSISGTGTMTLAATVGLTLNNTAGAFLQRPLTVNGTMTLTSGLVTTTSTNLLTIGPAGTISGASSMSYVNGPVARTIASAASTTVLFPTGKSVYRPVSLTVTQDAATSTVYIAECYDTAPPTRTLPSTLDRVSGVRYFALSKGTGANITNGSVTLSYDTDDLVTDYLYLRAAGDDGSNWTDLGGTGTANTAGTITSTVNFTSLSLFALANNVSGGNPLPVELAFFRADRTDAAVQLTWRTISEFNNREFVVERRAVPSRESWTRIWSVTGYGTTDTPHDYRFDDHRAPGILQDSDLEYRLRQIDRDGTAASSPIVTIRRSHAAGTTLLQNRPNPFNARTTISFIIAREQHASLEICDLSGQVLARPADAIYPAGVHAVSCDLADLPSGAYLYRLRTGDGLAIRRMIVLK